MIQICFCFYIRVSQKNIFAWFLF